MSNSWENECNILLYIYDKTYSIHKLIIHYSKHKLERAKYAHPFGKKIFLFLGLGVSRGGNSFWIQNLRDEKTILKPEQITPSWKQCFFLASVTSHWSRTLCSWWPALARVPGWERLSILCCLGKALTVAGVMISSRGPFLIEKGMSHTFFLQIGQCRLFTHILYMFCNIFFQYLRDLQDCGRKYLHLLVNRSITVEIFILAG